MIKLPKHVEADPAFRAVLALCDEVLITSAELAKHWRMTRQGLHAMRKRGAGPAYIRLPSGEVRYRLSELLAWELESR